MGSSKKRCEHCGAEVDTSNSKLRVKKKNAGIFEQYWACSASCKSALINSGQYENY